MAAPEAWLHGKVAAVTGAASGLGLATARHLAGLGARVALLDLNGEAAAAEATSLPGALGLALDVGDEHQAEAVFGQIQAALGPVRVLVNAAGIATPGNVLRRGRAMPLDEFEQVLRVNLLGSINCTRLAVAQMAALQRAGQVAADEDTGVVVHTASIAAYEGQVGQAAYSASKAGVAAMTLPMARELGPLGIRVVCIAPGVFATPMTLGLPEKSRAVVFAARPPHPPRPGRPDEYADLVAAIIGNRMLNGTVIRLDGGLRMPARL